MTDLVRSSREVQKMPLSQAGRIELLADEPRHELAIRLERTLEGAGCFRTRT